MSGHPSLITPGSITLRIVLAATLFLIERTRNLLWVSRISGRTKNVAILIATLALLPTPARAQDRPAPEGFIVDHSHSPHAILRPVPLEAVEWTSGFWVERYKQLAEVSLEESWRLLADPAAGHVMNNFRFATKPGSGQYQGTTWQDEWLYKWIEAAACVWRQNRDSALLQRMDEAIALIAAAQQPDGYLSTMPLARQLPRFQSAHDHEVYNMGHLLTAGVMHHQEYRRPPHPQRRHLHPHPRPAGEHGAPGVKPA